MSGARRRAEQEPAFVLHSYPYKETSLIVEAFSRRHGRVAVLARGARRPRSALRGVLHAFQPLRLAWSGAGELNTLTGAEWQGGLPLLQGFGLMCGFYLNELLLRLVPRDDPHEALFDAYATCLERLAHGESTPVVLRGFEKQLLAELGYAMMLDREAESGTPIDPAMQYLYDPERGPVAANGARRDDLVVCGRTLLELDAGRFSGAETLAEARNLMRGLIGQRLQGQTLHTRNVLMELQDL